MKARLLKRLRDESLYKIKAEVKYDDFYKNYYPVIYESNYFGTGQRKIYSPFREGLEYKDMSVKELESCIKKLLDRYRREYIINKLGEMKAKKISNKLFWF